jgi:hypothetical protein
MSVRLSVDWEVRDLLQRLRRGNQSYSVTLKRIISKYGEKDHTIGLSEKDIIYLANCVHFIREREKFVKMVSCSKDDLNRIYEVLEKEILEMSSQRKALAEIKAKK